MLRTFLRAKIHRARVTSARLDYEGSVSVGKRFLKALDLLSGERVDIYNITNAERFSTYVIEGDDDFGIAINGAAARLVAVGDLVIIAAYASVDLSKESAPTASVALVQDDSNRFEMKR
jgi:aspartate 1-decarboxylase